MDNSLCSAKEKGQINLVPISNKNILKFSVLLLLSLGLVLSASTAYYHVKRWQITALKAEQLALSRVAQTSLEQWLSINRRTITTIATTIGQANAPLEQNPNLDLLIKQYTDSQQFEFLSYGLEQNGYYRVNDWLPPAGYDPRERPWYQAAKTAGEEVILWPYEGADFKKEIFISIAAPIFRNERFVGVVSGKISQDYIEKIILHDGDKATDSGMLVDWQGTILFHPDGTRIGQNLYQSVHFDTDEISQASKLKGQEQVFWAGDELYVITPIPSMGLNFVRVVSEDGLNQRLISETGSMLGHFVIIFSMVMLAFYLLNRKILSPTMDLLELDNATALPNKKNFKSIVTQRYLTPKVKGILMLVNLDYFNTLIAAYPDLMIRQLLNKVKNRIQHLLEQDCILGVFSENRFVLFVPCTDPSITCCDHLPAKILHSLEQPFMIAGAEMNLSIHIGAAKFPHQATDIETLVNHAFSALSVSRRSGTPNYCLFDPDLNQETVNKHLMISSLRKGLREHELFMVYQPQFDIRTNQMVSMESLVRWNSSELDRLVLPGEFIEISENSDLVGVLGQYVFDRVVRQINDWQARGFTVPKVAVNISPKHLLQDDFIDGLVASLKKYQICAGQIEIELTETSMMEEPQRAINLLIQLKILGFSLAIDDFGSGYSSFQYLKMMPFDKLKIDRMFIRELEHSSNDRVIIQSLVSIAKHMNMTLLAEGVETPEQLAILKAQSVAQIQGFLYAEPMAPEDIEAIIVAQEKQTDVA